MTTSTMPSTQQKAFLWPWQHLIAIIASRFRGQHSHRFRRSVIDTRSTEVLREPAERPVDHWHRARSEHLLLEAGLSRTSAESLETHVWRQRVPHPINSKPLVITVIVVVIFEQRKFLRKMSCKILFGCGSFLQIFIGILVLLIRESVKFS